MTENAMKEKHETVKKELTDRTDEIGANLFLVQMCFLFLCYRKVKSHPNDDAQKQNVKETDNQQRLLYHHNFRESVLQIELMDVIFDQIIFRKLNDRPSERIQVRIVQRIGFSCYGIRCYQFDVRTSFGQNNLHHNLVDSHIVVNVIDESHLEQVIFTGVEQIFEAGNIVAESVMGFPSAE